MISAAPRILVHGHRGARAVLPENTLPAFEYAIREGADVLELDVWATADNVLVVHHDPLINTSNCTGPEGERAIRRLTLEQVKQWDCGAKKNPDFPRQEPRPGTRIPTLDEVLALAPRGSFWFNIEMKSQPAKPELQPAPEEYARLVAAAIRKHKLEHRVIVQSFDFSLMRALRAAAPELRRAALYAGLPRDFTELSREAGGTPIVSPHYSLVTPERVKQAHDAGLQVVPWTANTPELWDRLIAAQVDAIITDDPKGLIEHLRSKGLR
ncbi:MAG: glycerophosphodiester phosphodiesterase [Acidobacteriota bacterium]